MDTFATFFSNNFHDIFEFNFFMNTENKQKFRLKGARRWAINLKFKITPVITKMNFHGTSLVDRCILHLVVMALSATLTLYIFKFFCFKDTYLEQNTAQTRGNSSD